MYSPNIMLVCYRKENGEKQTIVSANGQIRRLERTFLAYIFGEFVARGKCQDKPLLGKAVVSCEIDTYSITKTDQQQKNN